MAGAGRYRKPPQVTVDVYLISVNLNCVWSGTGLRRLCKNQNVFVFCLRPADLLAVNGYAAGLIRNHG